MEEKNSMPAYVLYSYSETPELSVIIPSLDGYRDGNVDLLLSSLKNQSFENIEIIISIGETPNGHARNVGFKACNGSSKFLAFFDDDILIRDEHLLSKFVEALQVDEHGLVGAAQKPPPGSSWKQYWIAYDLTKTTSRVQTKYEDSEMVTHAGMACRVAVWKAHDGEDSNLVTGTDTDLRQRLRDNGFKVVLVPQTLVLHPLPRTFMSILKSGVKHGWYQLDYRRKHGFQKRIWSLFPKVDGWFIGCLVIIREFLFFIPHIFYTNRSPALGFRPINALFRFCMALGYVSRSIYKQTK